MHPFDIADTAAVPQTSSNPSRLEPMLVRLPPAMATELRNLARRTRVRQSDYLREAVADLIAKYAHAEPGAHTAAGSAM